MKRRDFLKSCAVLPFAAAPVESDATSPCRPDDLVYIENMVLGYDIRVTRVLSICMLCARLKPYFGDMIVNDLKMKRNGFYTYITLNGVMLKADDAHRGYALLSSVDSRKEFFLVSVSVGHRVQHNCRAAADCNA